MVNLHLTHEIIQMGTDRPQDFIGISILVLPNKSHCVCQYNPLIHTRCFQSSTFKHSYPNPGFFFPHPLTP